MCVQKGEPDNEKKSPLEPPELDTSDSHRHQQLSSGQNENLGLCPTDGQNNSIYRYAVESRFGCERLADPR
jgi:hypothetical protein